MAIIAIEMRPNLTSTQCKPWDAYVGFRMIVASGQIAAVLVEDLLVEATLKIFRRKKDRIELHAANSAYVPLVFEGKDMARVSIVGKLAGVIRRAG